MSQRKQSNKAGNHANKNSKGRSSNANKRIHRRNSQDHSDICTPRSTLDDRGTHSTSKYRLRVLEKRKGKIIQSAHHDVLSEIAGLLIDPITDIASKYNVPDEVFQKTVISSALLHITKPARTYHTVGSDANILQFNRILLADTDRSAEYFADIGIHEIGHILANYKRFAYLTGIDNDQVFMPLVPQFQDPFHGMNEGFAEFVRLKFSSETNRFPNARKSRGYNHTILGDFGSLLSILDETPIIYRLMSVDYNEGRYVVPSILYHALEKSKYEILIRDYNSWIRALQPQSVNHAMAQQLADSINHIFDEAIATNTSATTD